MENQRNYIEPIRENLDYWMHKNCQTFMVIGTPIESPRWFNFGGFDENTKELTIRSTQKELGFKIPTNFSYIDSNAFWGQFKKYRTNFLANHYPTIDRY